MGGRTDSRTNRQVDRQTDWLACPAGWQTDWLAWLDGWHTLIDWRTDELTDWRTDGLTDWRTDGLTDWRTDALTDWRTDGLTDWRTDRLTDWQADRLKDWQTDRVTSWQSGTGTEQEDTVREVRYSLIVFLWFKSLFILSKVGERENGPAAWGQGCPGANVIKHLFFCLWRCGKIS